MQHLIDSIEQSVRTQNWYAALALSLTMPDVCGKLQWPEKNRQRYFDWYNQYVQNSGPLGGPSFMCAEDCYALRCAFLHQGEFRLDGQEVRVALDRVHLTAPKPGLYRFNNLYVGRDVALQIDVDMFCQHMCMAVGTWLRDVQGDADIQGRLSRLAKLA